MPTIDQLAPATAASDTDLLLADQSGVTRSVTRAQLVAGLQPELVLPPSSLVGRSTAGAGAVETIQIGANLNLSSGTLSAAASPFVISALSAGVIPGGSDAIPVGQNGANAAVPYSEFVMGISAVAGINISGATLTPAGSASPQMLAEWAAGVLPITGGTLTGALALVSDPTSEAQAATKHYVDTQVGSALSNAGGTLTGPLSLPSLLASGVISCDGTLSVSGPITGSNATLAGTVAVGAALNVAGAAQFGTTVTCGNLAASGAVFVGEAVSAASIVTTGSAVIGGAATFSGAIIGQSGVTIAGGLAVMPSYQVTALPPSSAGALAYAGNGRKPGEPAGAGTGVLVWGTEATWLSIMNGTPVQA